MAGSYGNSGFKGCGFQIGRIIFPSHEECRKVQTSPCPCQHLLLSVLQIVLALSGYDVVSHCFDLSP